MPCRYLIFLLLVAGEALAAPSPAQPAPSQDASAQRQQQLAGVRSKLSQLRNEQAMNRVAMNGGELPANVIAGLQARARQLVAEIEALSAQERALTQ